MAAGTPLDRTNPYLGWIVGGIIILLVFAVMGTFWFLYHPL